MGIIEWLTANIGAIIIGIAVVLAIIISWKVYLRERLLKTANQPANIEKPTSIDKPDVVVFLRPHATCVQCLMLCIENIGAETAYNVQFGTGSTPFLNTPSSHFSDVKLLKKNIFLQKGISCFGPGQKIEQFLISLIGGLPEKLQQPLQISVTYSDSLNNTYENRYPLDFGAFESLVQINSVEDKATSDLNPLLQAMQTGFSHVVESIEGLKISQTSKPKSGEPSSQEVEKTPKSVRGEEDKPLSPDLQKLVTLYNTGEDAELRKIYKPPYSIRVTNETELYQNPNIDPIFKTMANGSFVAYAINPENLYAVVPFSGCILQNDLYSSGAFGKVFECPGFDSKFKYNVKVIRPAIFKRDSANEKWTLQERGKLELEEKDN